jgi:hypothetical protein
MAWLFNGDAAFFLQIHVVKYLSGHVAFADGSGQL